MDWDEAASADGEREEAVILHSPRLPDEALLQPARSGPSSLRLVKLKTDH